MSVQPNVWSVTGGSPHSYAPVRTAFIDALTAARVDFGVPSA